MKCRILFVAGLFFVYNQVNAQKINTGKVIAEAEKQTKLMLTEIAAAKEGKPELVSPKTIEKEI
jgi:hypothetical protein